MSEQIAGTQTFLIECNRGNSVIDSTAPASNNAKWESECDFQFQRGDRCSVEAIMIESSGAGTQAQTIEFSGENVRIADREQNWTDDTIILEFGFYVNNNGDRTINLPISFKHEIKQSTGLAGKSLKTNSGMWTTGQGGNPAQVASTRQYPGCSAPGFDPGYNYKLAGGAQTAYNVFAYEDITTPGVFTGPALNTTSYTGLVLCKSTDAGGIGLRVEYPAEKFPFTPADLMNGRNTEIAQGMGIYLKGTNIAGAIAPELIGIVNYIGTQPGGGDRLYVRFVDPWQPAVSWNALSGLLIVSTNIADAGFDDKLEARYGYSANPANTSQGLPNATQYKPGARIGIGLYNQSSPYQNVNVPPAQATAQQGMDINRSRLNGGAFLWETTRCFSAVNATQIPELGCYDDNAGGGANGARQTNTFDLRNYKDNAPYILVSPEYSGPQPTPNGRDMSPELQPMTAYVIIKAGNSFEDVNNLAEAFSSAFHSINPLLTGQGNKLQEYINNAVFPFNKANNVYPLTSRGYFSEVEAIDVANPPYYPNYTNTTAALWNKVSPLWIGNLMKCVPSNIINQPNWKYQQASPYFYHPQQTTDYLKVGDQGDWQWNNFIYGNMGVKNYAKCHAGDRFIRCECWDGNTALNPHRDIPRPVILNTQLRNPTAPIVVPGPPTAPGSPPVFQFKSTEIKQWETIFTNINYEITPSSVAAGADKYANLDRIQKAFRYNEKYQVTNPEAINGYANQNTQSWWTWEADLGMSDGNRQMNDLTTTRNLITPIQTNWISEAPPSALAVADNPGGTTTGGTITPSQSFLGQGGEINYQGARDSGRIQIYSRWFEEYSNPSLNSNVPFGAPLNSLENPTNTPIGAPPLVPVPSAFCQIKDVNGDWLYPGGIEESRKRNIGVIPYLYNDANGVGHFLCAFVVARDYEARPALLPVDPAPTQEASGTASWELGQFFWGDFFGWSPNFGYDSPACLPMNPDQIANQIKVPGDSTTPGPPPVLVPGTLPAEKWSWNNQNYSWVGANDAIMTFDNQKNRFSLTGLYTATTLAAVNLPKGLEGDSPQLGETIATLNTDQAGATNYQPMPALPVSYSLNNQGVQDSTTGVFLNNIYFAPKNWTPPTTINPQNLYNPYVGKLDPTTTGGQAGTLTYRNDTTVNRLEFLKDLTEATADNWQGNLMDKMGFDYNQLIPSSGEQDNRFSVFTYGREDLEFQNEGTKPLMMNSETDVAENLFVNIYVDNIPQAPSPAPSNNTGTPLYQNGLLNNEPLNLGDVASVRLTANRIPTLFACPFYLVISDICPTQFQSGSQKQECIFYGLKNYGAGQYFYVFGSSYSQLIDTARTITTITTEIRNPLTGRLARLSKNSCIIYKIERDIILPGITTDAVGQPINEPAPVKVNNDFSSMESELKKLVEGERGERSLLSTLIKNESKENTKISNNTGSMYTALKKDLKKHSEPIRVIINNRDNTDFGKKMGETKETKEPGGFIPNSLDIRDLHEDLIKLVVQKALVNFPITSGVGGNIQNASLLRTGVMNALERYSYQIQRILSGADEGEAQADIDEMIEEIKDDNLFLGVRGQIIRKKAKGKTNIFADADLLQALSVDAIEQNGAGIGKLLGMGLKTGGLSMEGKNEGSTLQELAQQTKDVMKDYKSVKYIAKRTGQDESMVIAAQQLATRIAGEDGLDLKKLMKEAERNPALFIRSISGDQDLSNQAMESFNRNMSDADKKSRIALSKPKPVQGETKEQVVNTEGPDIDV